MMLASIHPSTLASRGPVSILRRSHLLQLFWEDVGVFQSHLRKIISPTCPGSAQGPPPGCTWPKHLTEEVPRMHPNQMAQPSQIDWFSICTSLSVNLSFSVLPQLMNKIQRYLNSSTLSLTPPPTPMWTKAGNILVSQIKQLKSDDWLTPVKKTKSN